MDEILTTREAAKYLKISEGFLRKLIRRKKIRAYREGRRGGYRIQREEIDRYVRKKLRE